MESILVPIFVCVVLPVAIVLIVFLATINSDNKRAQVLIKAIEANNNIDVDRLAALLTKPKRTPEEMRNMRLLRGCMFTLIGLALLIMAVVNLYSADPDVTIASDEVWFPMIGGGVMMASGISYLIVYVLTGRKPADKERE